MALSRGILITRTVLRDLIRKEISDPTTEPDGTARPNDAYRFTDADINESLQWQLKEMSSVRTGWMPGESLLYVDLSGAVDADGVISFPAPLNTQSLAIYKVEETLSNGAAIVYPYASAQDMPKYGNILGTTEGPFRRRWTLLGGDDVTSALVRIQILPKVAGTSSIRVWYIAAPTIVGADGDSVPGSDQWEELIALGTARKLLRRDDEITPQQEQQYGVLWAQFMMYGDRHEGPKRIRRRRRGRT